MAYTSVKAIRFNINNSIQYVLDEKKTALENAIDYTYNRDKTETTLFENAVYCNKETAYSDMISIKNHFNKTDGVQGYHLVQSFQQGEVTPVLAHSIAREFAERLLGNGYQAVISTHLNTDHIHSHIVWNSVNYMTGEKYHSNAKSYYQDIRHISDELCRKHELSIIHPEPGNKGKSYSEWKAEKNGESTWRGMVRKVVDAAIQDSFSFSQFLSALEAGDWTIKTGKHLAVRPPGKERYIRLKSLGEGYSEEAIRERIVNQNIKDIADRRVQKNAAPQRPSRKSTVLRKSTLRSVFTMRGLKGLYFHYLYRMGVLPKQGHRWMSKETHFLLQEDIRQLGKRIRMYEYIRDHDIETLPQLRARQATVQQRIDPLLVERRQQYKRPGSETRIAEINAQLKPLWAERYLCRDIEKHSLDIAGKLRHVQTIERERRIQMHTEKHQQEQYSHDRA